MKIDSVKSAYTHNGLLSEHAEIECMFFFNG